MFLWYEVWSGLVADGCDPFLAMDMADAICGGEA